MHHIDPIELEGLRQKIEKERAAIEQELQEHGHIKNKKGEWQASSSGLEGEESDPTDVADQIEELVTNVPIVETLSRHHRELEDAMDAIERGTYGHCETCNEDIPLERLQANPSARTCIKHA